MAIRELWTVPRSQWQSPYVDHLIVLNEETLRQTPKLYFASYHRARTPLSLGKVAPEIRPVQPPELRSVVELPERGGLSHRYERRAA